MLVDESHRTNFGSFAARMRQMFPMACYLGFTGHPCSSPREQLCQILGAHRRLSIDQAVKDKACSALYEGRLVEMEQTKMQLTLGLSGIRKF